MPSEPKARSLVRWSAEPTTPDFMLIRLSVSGGEVRVSVVIAVPGAAEVVETYLSLLGGTLPSSLGLLEVFLVS